jgi:hypothetical protein
MKVLILGSAPDVIEAENLKSGVFDKIIAINNAWQVREDWDFCIFPNDFPKAKHPKNSLHKELVTYEQYVPIQNKFGGFVYAGGTMAFTAGYWALGKLKPDIITFLGCDMTYEGDKTHFYGKGSADPLRDDPTLASLLSKSARFEVIASLNNCSVLNLSKKKNSRLIFRRLNVDEIDKSISPRVLNKSKYLEALKLEKELKYFVEDGKYWKYLSQFDTKNLELIDSLWLAAIQKNNQS